MQKAVFLYNPQAGSRQERRRKEIEAACSVLRSAGVEARTEATEGPAESAAQAARAVREGCDTILACGGDGTVHNIMQGMVGTSAALGVIPFGTGNVLAHDLGIPRSAIAATHFALNCRPRRIAVGKIEYVNRGGKPAQRYFLAVLGVGVDAEVFYRALASTKSRLGMVSYYLRATHLWLTHRMESFAVEFRDERGDHSYQDIPQLSAVRITNFGGALRKFAPGAALERNDLRLVLFRTRQRLAYLRHITRCLLAGQWMTKGIEYANATAVVCRPLEGSQRILVEADGEFLGTLPAKISIVPDAITLLMNR